MKIIVISSLLLFGSLASNAHTPIKNRNSLKEIIIPTENVLYATFVTAGFDGGDLYGLVFKDDKGKFWDFGSGDNNLGDFNFGEDETLNQDLVGKKFIIIWENKISKSYDETGENVIEIEAMSIVKIEILK